ncbi:hypothetical protein Back11_49240 [Paenibacillus baekrokdamisoli]|uniref:Uncharacterized protein n=1 Tax=Paenibacillus baekrokdamisoli TaxID=1712516 RepID=A0A3G9JKK2_9BACL|nr:hypothetical protein Back11_49240 [Paenibacillus baekrokdamisoli]
MFFTLAGFMCAETTPRKLEKENESVRYRYEFISYFSNKVLNLKYYLDSHSSMSYYTNTEVIT